MNNSTGRQLLRNINKIGRTGTQKSKKGGRESRKDKIQNNIKKKGNKKNDNAQIKDREKEGRCKNKRERERERENKQ